MQLYGGAPRKVRKTERENYNMKNLGSHVLLAIIIITSFVAGIAEIIGKDFVIALIFLVFGVVILAYEISMIRNELKNRGVEEKKLEEDKLLEEGMFYRLCVKQGITSINSDSAKRRAEKIATENDIEFRDVAKLFKRSKEADEKMHGVRVAAEAAEEDIEEAVPQIEEAKPVDEAQPVEEAQSEEQQA